MVATIDLGIILGVSSLEHLKQNMAECAMGPLPSQALQVFDQVWKSTSPYIPTYYR